MAKSRRACQRSEILALYIHWKENQHCFQSLSPALPYQGSEDNWILPGTNTVTNPVSGRGEALASHGALVLSFNKPCPVEKSIQASFCPGFLARVPSPHCQLVLEHSASPTQCSPLFLAPCHSPGLPNNKHSKQSPAPWVICVCPCGWPHSLGCSSYLYPLPKPIPALCFPSGLLLESIPSRPPAPHSWEGDWDSSQEFQSWDLGPDRTGFESHICILGQDTSFSESQFLCL